MGQMQRTVGVSNLKTAIVTAKAGRTVNPLDITITNTDTAAHIVDFFDGVAGATPIFTLFVPSDGTVGGGAFHSDREKWLTAMSQKLSPGNALAAASRNAVGGAGLEFFVDFGRL